MKILFEDNHIIVIEKPIGVPSQSDLNKTKSITDMLSEHLKSKGEESKIYVLHRLDRNVGGVMVYAKTKLAASEISKQIQSGIFQKEYLAVIHSKPETDEGVLEDLLFKDSSKNKTFVVKRVRKGVKKAKLSYKLLESIESEYGELSLIRVHLYTGRTHQIRVQFASRKMPLFGDVKYGSKDNNEKIGLYSCSISFVHPQSKKEMSFERMPTDTPFDRFTKSTNEY